MDHQQWDGGSEAIGFGGEEWAEGSSDGELGSSYSYSYSSEAEDDEEEEQAPLQQRTAPLLADWGDAPFHRDEPSSDTESNVPAQQAPAPALLPATVSIAAAERPAPATGGIEAGAIAGERAASTSSGTEAEAAQAPTVRFPATEPLQQVMQRQHQDQPTAAPAPVVAQLAVQAELEWTLVNKGLQLMPVDMEDVPGRRGFNAEESVMQKWMLQWCVDRWSAFAKAQREERREWQRQQAALQQQQRKVWAAEHMSVSPDAPRRPRPISAFPNKLPHAQRVRLQLRQDLRADRQRRKTIRQVRKRRWQGQQHRQQQRQRRREKRLRQQTSRIRLSTEEWVQDVRAHKERERQQRLSYSLGGHLSLPPPMPLRPQQQSLHLQPWGYKGPGETEGQQQLSPWTDPDPDTGAHPVSTHLAERHLRRHHTTQRNLSRQRREQEWVELMRRRYWHTPGVVSNAKAAQLGLLDTGEKSGGDGDGVAGDMLAMLEIQSDPDPIMQRRRMEQRQRAHERVRRKLAAKQRSELMQVLATRMGLAAHTKLKQKRPQIPSSNPRVDANRNANALSFPSAGFKSQQLSSPHTNIHVVGITQASVVSVPSESNADAGAVRFSFPTLPDDTSLRRWVTQKGKSVPATTAMEEAAAEATSHQLGRLQRVQPEGDGDAQPRHDLDLKGVENVITYEWPPQQSQPSQRSHAIAA
eukprot:g2314.t1